MSLAVRVCLDGWRGGKRPRENNFQPPNLVRREIKDKNSAGYEHHMFSQNATSAYWYCTSFLG
jgi:hypothetical protein